MHSRIWAMITSSISIGSSSLSIGLIMIAVDFLRASSKSQINHNSLSRIIQNVKISSFPFNYPLSILCR
ncbi:hypothetical protein B9Z45_14495 [Limnohabitans sp. 2KL-17]|nr:hypothetical protein B9Z45_14495 [Limnohabitans sp. 2KL-17]